MTDNQIITKVLQNFWQEMFAWETECNAYVDNDQDPPDEVYYGKLTAIYNQFVVSKERKMGRLTHQSILFPPEFDPEKEEIQSIEINKNSASVTTQGTHANLEKTRIYKLKKIADNWLIDSVKELDTYDQKWFFINL